MVPSTTTRDGPSGYTKIAPGGRAADVRLGVKSRRRRNNGKQWQEQCARSIGTVGHPGECSRPVGRRKAGDRAACEPPPARPSGLQDWWMRPGAQFPDWDFCLRQSANARNNEITSLLRSARRCVERGVRCPLSRRQQRKSGPPRGSEIRRTRASAKLSDHLIGGGEQ
jgi:hypothetical protein